MFFSFPGKSLITSNLQDTYVYGVLVSLYQGLWKDLERGPCAKGLESYLVTKGDLPRSRFIHI